MNRQTKNKGRLAGGIAWPAFVGALLLTASAAQAQRIKFENVTVVPRDDKTATLRFDIGWSGTFRNDITHDAAWVFFKVRAKGAPAWQHARLVADRVLNPTGYGQAEGGTPIDFLVPSGEDGFTGMFVRLAQYSPGGRGGEGGGGHEHGATLSAKNATAIWDFSANTGISKETEVEVTPYGFSMVYVATGPFYLGTDGFERYAFYQYTDGKQDTKPYRVTGPGAIPTGQQAGRLWARGATPEDGGEIPAAYPNGYNGFYTMWEPIRGDDWAFFLRMLTPEQAKEHCRPEGNYWTNKYFGNMVRSGEYPNHTYKGGGRLNWISWADGAAFSAWAGLRPITDLEQEKMLRGFRYPAPNETASFPYWCERKSFGGGAYNASPRWRVVAVDEVGRKFAGTHGRGDLTPPEDWPKADSKGTGVHGGFWTGDGLGLNLYRTSDRTRAAWPDPERKPFWGWRSARTAPAEAASPPSAD